MQKKLYTFAAFLNLGIGILGILTFMILACSEQARGGEPLRNWLPVPALAILCVLIGSVLLRVSKK